MFDFNVEATVNADGSVSATCKVTKDGKPDVDYSVVYYGMSAEEAGKLQQYASEVLAQVSHKNLKNRAEMHAVQRKLVNRLLEYGDEQLHGKK